MPADRNIPDIFNDAVKAAAELAYRQVQALLDLLPNPPGTESGGARLTRDEIDRLKKGV